MNQKLLVYIKKGMHDSKSALHNQKPLFFKYFLFVLTSFLGKLFFITYPLFALADIRIAKSIEETGKFELEKSFEDSNLIKTVWTTMLFILLKTLILISGTIILSGLTFMLASFGTTIDSMTTLKGNYMTYFFGSLGVIAIVVFIIMVNLYLGPATYIIQSNDDVGISDVFTKSIEIMNKNGKSTLLLIKIFHLLRFLINLIVCIGLIWVIHIFSNPLIETFCIIILSIVLLLTLPRIVLSNKISSYSLFKKLTDKEDILNNSTKIKVKKEELLVTLFDDLEIKNEEI